MNKNIRESKNRNNDWGCFPTMALLDFVWILRKVMNTSEDLVLFQILQEAGNYCKPQMYNNNNNNNNNNNQLARYVVKNYKRKKYAY